MLEVGTEGHFREALSQGDRAAVLLVALEVATEQAHDAALDWGFILPRTEPVVAFDFAVTLMEPFEQSDGVERKESKGQYLWIVDTLYGLRVKKLDHNYRSSNHYSQQQELISQQKPLPGFPDLVYVTVGAVHDSSDLVTGFAAVKYLAGPMGTQRVEWVVDLRDLAAGGTVPTVPVLPIEPAAPVAPAVLLPKRVPDRMREGDQRE